MQRYVVLFEGDTGQAVKQYQDYLNLLRGINVKPEVQSMEPLVADGVFGKKTKSLSLATLGTEYGVIETEGSNLSNTRKQVIKTALLRLKNPLEWAPGNFIDTEILGPMRKLIDAKESHRFPWCASWCTYVLRSSDEVYRPYPLKTPSGVMTSVSNYRKEAMRLGALKDKEQAVTGDLIAYDWTHDGSDDHIGFFYGLRDGKIVSLEGNASDSEAVRFRNPSSATFCIDVEKLVQGHNV